jgi:hypothetical protein
MWAKKPALRARMALLGLVVGGCSKPAPDPGGASTTASVTAIPSGAPAAPTEVCRVICESNAYGKCPADPKGSDCYSLCEKARSTQEGRCTSQVDAMLRCLSKQPADQFECGPTGGSQPVKTACAPEVQSMQQCVQAAQAQ